MAKHRISPYTEAAMGRQDRTRLTLLTNCNLFFEPFIGAKV